VGSAPSGNFTQFLRRGTLPPRSWGIQIHSLRISSPEGWGLMFPRASTKSREYTGAFSPTMRVGAGVLPGFQLKERSAEIASDAKNPIIRKEVRIFFEALMMSLPTSKN